MNKYPNQRRWDLLILKVFDKMLTSRSNSMKKRTRTSSSQEVMESEYRKTDHQGVSDELEKVCAIHKYYSKLYMWLAIGRWEGG